MANLTKGGSVLRELGPHEVALHLARDVLRQDTTAHPCRQWWIERVYSRVGEDYRTSSYVVALCGPKCSQEAAEAEVLRRATELPVWWLHEHS